MKPVFFILSIGRCGTMTIAKLIPNFQHEPDAAEPSIIALQKRIIKATGYYGETSNFWREHLDELTDAFPKAIYIHLVRNGIDSVKSLITRGLYDEGYKVDHAHKSLPIDGFDIMIRFEKVCWYWRYWNEVIETYAPLRIRFEDISHLFPVMNKGDQPVEFSPEEVEIFNKVCEIPMNRYGY